MINYVEPVYRSNLNENSQSEQFIIKRTETTDLLYFASEINNNNSALQSYTTFFSESDIEMIYETTYFSITVIDIKNENQLVGIFFFNDSPFTVYKRDDFPQLSQPGMWEEWFYSHYSDTKIDGKNSLWLVYFLLKEEYLNSEEILKRIFHKVHLSLYTTLPFIETVLMSVNKQVYMELDSIIHHSQKQDVSTAAAMISFRAMTEYLYEILSEEVKSDMNSIDSRTNTDSNRIAVLINKRAVVFPLIEIREGTQEDHDDLENIFKDQTPPEISNCYEDFFIAKMIANQDEKNKVLVGQVNDKAIGILAVSTDMNLPLLIKSFELENYDNLLKQDYMKAVKLKRKQLREVKEKHIIEEEKSQLLKYKQEIMKCEKISQRIYLQEHIKNCEKVIEDLENVEKNAPNKEDLTAQMAHTVILDILSGYDIIKPELEKFENTLKVDSGSCLLTSPFKFFIETLEFFGLPKGYMQGNGHWTDWLQKEAQRKAVRELMIKKLNKDKPKKVNRLNKKENEEPTKPSYFDFSPLAKAMRLFKNANLRARTFLRKIILENKNLIASFFVNEEGEPSETKCFDIMSLKKKLALAKIQIPYEYEDMIGPIFLCFGNLPYQKRTEMQEPEEEVVVLEKRELKNKKKKDLKKKGPKEEEEGVKKEVKLVPVTLYEVSISDFFKSIETSFMYDKLIYELGIADDNEFKKEYNLYIQSEEERGKKNLMREKSEYEKLREETIIMNIKDSEAQLAKYEHILKDYFDEDEVPPTPPEILNAFCTKLFFIEQAFESRSIDFLMQAFDCFPEKDYLIVTQPHSHNENSLLQSFIKVEKKLDSMFNEVMFVIHKESLLIHLLKVTKSNKKDLTNSAYLFENLGSEGESMFNLANETISNQHSKFICVSAKINENNIGIFLISKEVNVSYYDSHFNVRDYTNLEKISKYMQGRIIFFLLHKNFQPHIKLIFKEIVRLTNKISLYYELSPNVEKCPIFVKEATLLRNRRFPHLVKKKYIDEKMLYEDEKIKSRTDGGERDEIDEEESEFCLVMTTKKMFAESKIANNNRIVVVGASDTGISFIESLLSIRYLEFSYVYLIAPGGLLYHHIEEEIQNLKISMTNYQIKELKKLLLEHRIKIINSKVIDIKPSQKYIQLEDFSVLNYDYLILTLGLQDRLWNEVKTLVTKQIDEAFKDLKNILVTENPKDLISKQNILNTQYESALEEFKDVVISVDDPELYNIFNPLDRKILWLRKNPKYNIILYGRSINLLCFIQGLLNRNVPANKIRLVIPNILEHLLTREEKIKFKKENQSINEEQLFVNGNSFEDSKELEEYLLKSLELKGVKVLYNYNLVGVNLDENQKIASYRFLEDGTNDKFEELSGNIIVTGGLLDVDQTVFNFIHENRLVYNGRAIIDRNFMTADSFIYAAGRLCEFSQRYSYVEKLKLMRLER